MEKALIILNHLSKDDILYHYNWHKRICDTKVVWQTTIYTIDVPGKIMVPNVMRILSYYASKFDYKYYCLMAGDCIILRKEFFNDAINYMKAESADVCFTHINSMKEHYKSLFDPMIIRNYGVPETKIRWSLNICNILTRKAVDLYNKKSHMKIYDEADFPNVFYNRVNTVLYPDIDYCYFSAANLARVDNKRIKGMLKAYGGRIKAINDENKNIDLIHAVKNYKLLDEFNIKLK
jgi:hypothetical protein